MRALKWGLGILVTVVMVFLLVFLPWKMSFAVSTPLEGTPADQGLAFESVVLAPSDQTIELAGWWIPSENPKASILFIHGGNGNRTDPNFGTLAFYKALHDRGYNILAIDLRNHGASGKSATGRLTFGREEKFDAAAGVAWIRKKQPDIPLLATGISMGGATVIHMAAAGIETDGLILIDPVLNNQDVMTRSLHAILGWPMAALVPTGWAAQVYFAEIYGLNDPGVAAETLDTPILLISDEFDPVARVEYARALAVANPSVQLLVIPKSPKDGPTLDQGRWAGHITAFLRQPDTLMNAIDRFVAGSKLK